MRAPAVLAAAGAAAAGAPALFLYFRVWPEIVVPAYFVSRGALLYRDVFFPHTPLLILATGFLGRIFGFSTQIASGVSGGDLLEALALLLAIPTLRPLRRCLPSAWRLRFPAAAMLLGAFGMAWPRWSLPHLAALSGLASLLAARAILVAATVLREPAHASGRVRRLGLVRAGGRPPRESCGRGDSFRWLSPRRPGRRARLRLGRPGYRVLRRAGARAHSARRCLPELLPRVRKLYAITGTTTPDGTYANATFCTSSAAKAWGRASSRRFRAIQARSSSFRNPRGRTARRSRPPSSTASSSHGWRPSRPCATGRNGGWSDNMARCPTVSS